MNREELLIALYDWKDTITDVEWSNWVEYKSNGTYSTDLITHNNDERIVAIYFFCADTINSIKQNYK